TESTVTDEAVVDSVSNEVRVVVVGRDRTLLDLLLTGYPVVLQFTDVYVRPSVHCLQRVSTSVAGSCTVVGLVAGDVQIRTYSQLLADIVGIGDIDAVTV